MDNTTYFAEYDNKSLGDNKRLTMFINKRNGKKHRYHNIKSKSSISSLNRNLIKSEIGELIKHNDIDEYTVPSIQKRFLNWWDCGVYRPKVWSNNKF